MGRDRDQHLPLDTCVRAVETHEPRAGGRREPPPPCWTASLAVSATPWGKGGVHHRGRLRVTRATACRHRHQLGAVPGRAGRQSNTSMSPLLAEVDIHW